MRKNGMTLIELMVAFFILAVLSVPMYFLLKESANKRALVASRDFVKQEANKVLKILESDLSQARKGTFKQASDDVISIKVRKSGSKKEEDVALSYLYVKPDLIRRFEGKQWVICRNVEEFGVAPAIDGVGRLVVSLKVKAGFDGIKEGEEPEYSQEKLIVMHEDSSEELDKYWRDVGDVSKFFATQGSIMAGVKADAKQLVQDFSSEWSAAGADISNMTIGQLQKVKDDLFKGLKDVETSITKLDKDILELDSKAMFDVGCDGKLSDSEKDRANAVKQALANMTEKGDLSWEKVVSAGGGGGFLSSNMKTGAIKEFYNAKAQLFNSGQEIVNQIDDFKKMSSEGGFEFETSEINRGKWGL